MNALRPRLLIVTALLLIIFLLLVGLTLDRAFYSNAESNLRNNLHTHLTLLLASTEMPNRDDVDMSRGLMGTRFTLPSSGLYAYVLDGDGRVLWKSLSTASIDLPAPQLIVAGEQTVNAVEHEGADLLHMLNGVEWNVEGKRIPLSYNVYLDLAQFNQSINDYRRTLWGWLFVVAAILIPAQMLLLLWMLTPLHRVVAELNAIENGKQEKLSANYPKEIRLLTNNINELLEHEHKQQTRYRNALADLAHSLKTPLATLNTTFSELKNDPVYPTLQEQIQRMDKIIGHQLQRAATAGGSPGRKSLLIKPVIEKLVQALTKVYHNKTIDFKVELDDDFTLRMDEGDLMEVMGNLLDNACKFCQQQVRISAESDKTHNRIIISDDGGGVAEEQFATIVTRGGRLDQSIPGQGIGLSVANEIINAYQGELRVEQSSTGGAAFILELPTA